MTWVRCARLHEEILARLEKVIKISSDAQREIMQPICDRELHESAAFSASWGARRSLT